MSLDALSLYVLVDWLIKNGTNIRVLRMGTRCAARDPEIFDLLIFVHIVEVHTVAEEVLHYTTVINLTNIGSYCSRQEWEATGSLR